VGKFKVNIYIRGLIVKKHLRLL